MLGRGLIARPESCAPDRGGAPKAASWRDGLERAMRPMIQVFLAAGARKLAPVYAPGRLKQWLRRARPEFSGSAAMFDAARGKRLRRLDELVARAIAGACVERLRRDLYRAPGKDEDRG